MLFLGGGFWYWQVSKNKQNGESQYSLEKAVKGDVAVSFDVEGKIAYQRWDLNFSQSGIVKKINVSLGEKVKKNQILATLEAGRVENQIMQAEAQTKLDILNSEGFSESGADYKIKKKAYDNAEEKLDAEKELYDEYIAQNGENSTQTLAQKVKVKAAEADLDNAKAQLKQAEELYQKALYQLDKSQAAQDIAKIDANDLKIIAPVSGAMVASINGLEGMNFSQNNNTNSEENFFITLIDPEKFWFEAYLEDIDALKVNNGMKAYVSLDAYSDKKFEGSVEFVSPIATIDNNGITSYKTIISLDGGEEKILSDMIGSAMLVSKEVKDVVVVSNNAVYLKDSKQMISVKEDGVIKEREITTGFTNGKKVEIKNGVKAGEEVVIFK